MEICSSKIRRGGLVDIVKRSSCVSTVHITGRSNNEGFLSVLISLIVNLNRFAGFYKREIIVKDHAVIRTSCVYRDC